MTLCCFQKCGIEKLVDELCAKLKEIQSEGKHIQYTNFCCWLMKFEFWSLNSDEYKLNALKASWINTLINAQWLPCYTLYSFAVCRQCKSEPFWHNSM